MPKHAIDRKLRVQTVLYRNDLTQLWRLARGLAAALRVARDAKLVSEAEWAFGDSSPIPIMTRQDARLMRDATADVFSDITYDFFDANMGSSGGQNQLAEGPASELLLVLNPDTYPSPTALAELLTALRGPDVAIAEPRQIPLEHPREYDRLTGDTGWASGFCMLIKRAVFDQMGGFDSDYFLLHCDDVDLSWRVRAAGYRIVVAPRAAVFHDKRPQLDVAWPAPDAEVYHAALGRLMLATRWDRPDIVAETCNVIELSGSAVQKEALADFRKRSEAGEIPTTWQGASSVAQFIDGEYARHRF